MSTPDTSAAAAAGVAAAKSTKPAKGDAKEEVDKLVLNHAEVGKVVTRFPPEASGYIHIGHAKAALVNRMLADKYEGKMVFRFDDTNPDKEKHEFEEQIMSDLAKLGVTWEVGPTYSSDYMALYTEKANLMIEEGTAYADFTDREEMRRCRMVGEATKCRDHSIEENKRLWAEMQAGSEEGQKTCLRAKMSVDDNNKALRDPVLFRVNLTPHARQGRKYNAYPTYDFCCPLIDSVEGVTHALRTNEYHDRNPQYEWILDTLKMRKPLLEDFSRLNMEYTVMSKRKLTALVEQGAVDGWDDPRFPTFRALCRRGLKVDALREFVKVQGMSKTTNFMEWSKLWNYNIQILNPTAPRYTAVSDELKVACTIVNGPVDEAALTRPRHKQLPELGEKPFFRTNAVLMDAEDIALIKEGDEVTLMDWCNAFIKNIKFDETTKLPCSADIELNPTGDVKKTKFKLTWVPNDETKTVAVRCNEYDHLLMKKKPDPEESIDGLIAPVTKFTQVCRGEVAMAELKVGEFLQIERRGYYIVDKVEAGMITLIAIPDGREKVNHLCAKYQYMKTLPPAATSEGKATVAKGTKADDGLSLEEKRALKAAKKAGNGKKSDKAEKSAPAPAPAATATPAE